MNRDKKPLSIIGEIYHRLLVAGGSVMFTMAFFMVLPLIQTLSSGPPSDMLVRSVDTALLEPPPPPPEEEEEPEPEEEEEPEPPELTEEVEPLDLSQLELALNSGFDGTGIGGDFAVNLNSVAADSEDVDALFSIADLDQQPRAIYQPGPRITPAMRARAPGQVHIIFIVDQDGRVENPIVQKSSDPVFEKAALDALEKWKFEPGKRNGKPVRFRMRVPFTFPEGL